MFFLQNLRVFACATYTSKPLGHADQSLAGKQYICYDWNKTDRANRKVIDYFNGE